MVRVRKNYPAKRGYFSSRSFLLRSFGAERIRGYTDIYCHAVVSSRAALSWAESETLAPCTVSSS